MANDFTFGGIVHATNNAQQGGFTRPVTTYQAHATAGGNIQVHAGEHPGAHAMLGEIAFVYVNHFNHCITKRWV